jgi:hypothetical protein
MNARIRLEVTAAIKDVIRDAVRQGLDGLVAARRAFPGTPEQVLAGAWWEVEEELAEQWWTTVERTIDAEIIRKAIASAAPGASGQGRDDVTS